MTETVLSCMEDGCDEPREVSRGGRTHPRCAAHTRADRRIHHPYHRQRRADEAAHLATEREWAAEFVDIAREQVRARRAAEERAARSMSSAQRTIIAANPPMAIVRVR